MHLNVCIKQRDNEIHKQNGAEEHPVFSFLKGQPGCNGNLMWNFRTKCIPHGPAREMLLHAMCVCLGLSVYLSAPPAPRANTAVLVAKNGTVSRHDGVTVANLEPEILKRLDGV